MSWTIWMAAVIVLITIAALLKRIETRLVLFTSGLVMALLAGAPETALKAFMANMTNGSLITSICSSLGFAAVIAITRCDVHFVGLMVKPLGKLGLFLLPFCMLIASCVAVAIPSAAGCAAALGPTMIPLMVRAGFKPAIAGAAIIGSIIPSAMSPGSKPQRLGRQDRQHRRDDADCRICAEDSHHLRTQYSARDADDLRVPGLQKARSRQ